MTKKPGPQKPKGYKRRSISITDEAWERLNLMADDCGVSVSEYIRDLIDIDIRNHKGDQ